VGRYPREGLEGVLCTYAVADTVSQCYAEPISVTFAVCFSFCISVAKCVNDFYRKPQRNVDSEPEHEPDAHAIGYAFSVCHWNGLSHHGTPPFMWVCVRSSHTHLHLCPCVPLPLPRRLSWTRRMR
jgi:hypothetical protein